MSCSRLAETSDEKVATYVKRVNIVVPVWLLLCLPVAAQMTSAQNAFNPVIGGVPVVCTGLTPMGPQRVAFVPDPTLNDIGRARPGFPPVILLNTALLASLPPKLQLFWYGHECAHHALGQLIAGPSPASESDADCWAIRTGRDQGLFTRQDVMSFAPWFASNPGSPWGHLPGPARLQNFLGCFDAP